MPSMAALDPPADPYKTFARLLLLAIAKATENCESIYDTLCTVISQERMRQLVLDVVQEVEHGRCMLTDEERYGVLGCRTRR